MLISIKRDGHFGKPKIASFDSIKNGPTCQKKKKVNSLLFKESRKCIFGKEGMRSGIAFCEGKRK